MLEELEAYLDNAAAPALRDLVLDACKTLSTAGAETHVLPLTNIVHDDDVIQTDAAHEAICGTLEAVLIKTLLEFGIEVSEHASLQVLNSMLKGLTAITNWDDPETINGLTDSQEDNESILADILVVVGDLTIGDYMEAIAEVSDDLIDRIRQTTDITIDGPQPDPALVTVSQKRLRTLLLKTDFQENSVFVKALNGGLRLGLPIEDVVAPNMTALHELPVDKLGAELVAFAFASSLPTEVVPNAVNALKESFTLSIPDMILLDTEIKRLLQG